MNRGKTFIFFAQISYFELNQSFCAQSDLCKQIQFIISKEKMSSSFFHDNNKYLQSHLRSPSDKCYINISFYLSKKLDTSKSLPLFVFSDVLKNIDMINMTEIMLVNVRCIWKVCANSNVFINRCKKKTFYRLFEILFFKILG